MCSHHDIFGVEKTAEDTKRWLEAETKARQRVERGLDLGVPNWLTGNVRF